MSELTVRAIKFRFEDDVPFIFNKHHVECSKYVNALTVFAPYFEGYVISATRKMLPRIKDDRLRHEADLFCRQEGVHSKYHYDHLQLLLRQYPRLEKHRKKVAEAFQTLRREQSDEYALAYAATTEILIGPTVKFLIEQRDALFGDGDRRIASFALWHFVEEFEHRNSALDIYNEVVGGRFYRLRKTPHILRQFISTINLAYDGIDEIIREERLDRDCRGLEPSVKIPPSATASLIARMILTLSPFYNPERLRQPDWASEWFNAYDAGIDMAIYFPSER